MVCVCGWVGGKVCLFLNQSLEVIHLDRVSPGLHDVVLDNVLDSGNYTV